MSTCISRHGEYSEHEAGDWCPRCGEFNEAAIVAERDQLRALLAAHPETGDRLREALLDSRLHDRIAQACGDPGSYVARGDNFREPISRSCMRAVLHVLATIPETAEPPQTDDGADAPPDLTAPDAANTTSAPSSPDLTEHSDDIERGYAAVFEVIGNKRQGDRPSSIEVNALIWNAVHAFKEALRTDGGPGVDPAGTATEQRSPGPGSSSLTLDRDAVAQVLYDYADLDGAADAILALARPASEVKAEAVDEAEAAIGALIGEQDPNASSVDEAYVDGLSDALNVVLRAEALRSRAEP